MIQARVISEDGKIDELWWFEVLPRSGERITLLISAPPSTFEVWRVDHVGLVEQQRRDERQAPTLNVRPAIGH